MTVYLKFCELAVPKVFYKTQKKLNAEFFEKGRVIGAVSFLYYPVQHGPMAHGEIEIEGSCYCLKSCVGPWNIPRVKSYPRRIYKIRRSNDKITELAFVRFGILVTPKQLDHIQNNIVNLRSMVGFTCMHSVKRALKKYTGYSIPFPICLYPTTTAGALCLFKNVFGSKKITRIDPQITHRSAGLIFLDVHFAIIPEMIAIALCVSYLYTITLWCMIRVGNVF